MKKLLFAGIGFLVLLVAAALIGPSLVDWNRYKGDIGALVKRATGRDLLIAGDVRINVLPAPALVAHDVRLANLPGATAPDMMRLKSMEVRVALLPLLGGSVQVETVRLIEPAIEIEVFADGRSNLSFAARPAEAGEAGRPDGGGTGAEASSPSVSLDSFAIQNGTLIYRDRRNGRVERIAGIEADIAADSLNGPFEAKGSLLLRGLPLHFDIGFGEIIQERTVPVNATVESRPSGAKASLSATLAGLGETPRLKGKLRAEGANLAALAAALGGVAELPGALAQAFKLEGEIQSGADRTEVSNLSFQLGDMQGTAVGSLQPGDTAAVSAAVSIVRVDLDSWLALPPFRVGAAKPAAREVAAGTPGQPAPPAAPPTAVFAIPDNLIGILDLNVGAIGYRGNLIRDLRASADLGNGRIEINPLSAQLPGSSEAQLSGSVTAVNGKPRFDGDLALTVSDLRGVLDWLGTPLPGVPGDRLRRTTARSNIGLDAEQLQLSALDLQIDGSRITGALTLALRDRPSFGANLSIDKLNLDSYLPPITEAETGPGGQAAAAGPGGRAATAAPAAAGSGGQPPAGGLAVLQAFDTNLRARIDSLTYQRTAIRDVALDLTLVRGDVQIRQAAVADVAGSSLALSGGLAGLGGATEAKGLRIDLKSPDTARLFRLSGITPPLPPEQLGPVTLGGLFDGPLLAPTVDATLTAAGGEMSLKGKVSPLSADALLDGRLSLKHPDLPRLLRLFAIDYRPVGPVGAVAMSAEVTGGPAKAALRGIDGSLGGMAVKGEATFDGTSDRPRLTARLQTGDLVVDRFLPPQRAAGLPFPIPSEDRAKVVPAAWPPPPAIRAPSPFTPVAVDERWSRQPLNTAALQALDAEVTLSATALAYQGYRLEQADVAATLASGQLKTERLRGKLFGGAFTGSVALQSTAATTNLAAELNLQGGNLAQLLAATGSADKATGTIATELALTGTGANMAELIGALAGKGRFALTGVDTAQAARGSPLAGLFELLTGLDRFGGALSGGRSDGRADLTGTFAMDKGIAQSDDIKLASALGNGTATGQIDLPAWQIDLQGKLDLKQNLVAAYLTRNTSKVPTTIPFQVRGPLDRPNVRIETAGIGGQALPIPTGVIDKLLERNSGAGKVLQQVLPELGAEPAPEAAPAQPPPQAEQQPAAPQKPEDLIRGLLRGITR